ncbi:MAG: hypothetical protein LBI09_03515 [Nitrososphaerota archaeon]|jgi:hypothetical protein|nr:hypothetical protein [Nitrososphaerota archaeon]
MSFGDSLKGLGVVQEALILGIMIVSILSLLYFDFDWKVKIGITAIAIALLMLTSIAGQLLNIQKEIAKAQR